MTSDRASSRLRVLIDLAQRELGKRFVGLVFLTERHLEKLHRLVQAKFSGPRFECAVAGDLVMLDRLRGGQDACVQGGRSLNSFISSWPSSMMPTMASQVFPLGVSSISLNTFSSRATCSSVSVSWGPIN